MKLVFEETERGFRRAVFTDFYGSTNSIQESSIATESCIWLGCETTMNNAPSTRMHLTRGMVAELLPGLCQFVIAGDLSDLPVKDGGMSGPSRTLDDAYQILTQEIGYWMQMDVDATAKDALEGEIQSGIRMGAIGALSNVIARITLGDQAFVGGDVIGRIGVPDTRPA